MLKKLNSFLRIISSHFLPVFLIAVLTSIMVFSWFRYGYLYGGGDVGLPTYDPIRIFNIVKNIWWDVHAPGFPYPGSLTAISFYLILIPLQKLGLSPVVIQALVFGILIFLSGAGFYALYFELTPQKSKTASFVAAVFYMLNPYVVIQVWHRFVHTAFFLTALLPILTFIYIKILKSGKFHWFLAFLITSFVFTYTFGSLPFMIVIWIPIIIYSLWECLTAGNIKSILRTFILLFLSWILLNAWWLYPFWTTGPAIYEEVHTIYASISTLISLSAQSSIPMVLRGLNSFYTFGDGAWVPGYDLPVMQIISWILPFVALIGIYSILIHRRKDCYVWILLFLVGIFLSKGSAAPFGYPFLWFFSKSFFLGAFRNPFEKLGIIVPFASAFIFSAGIEQIYSWLRNYFSIKRIWVVSIIFILLTLEFVVYVWPVWLGRIFGSLSQPAFVRVPDSYKKADEWIVKQGVKGRILQLPFATGDAITYFWGEGYNGIEPSSLLFKTPSVSVGFGLGILDNDLAAINNVFTTDNFDESELGNVLSTLDIKYIIIHKDVDWKTRKLTDPDKLINILSKVDFVHQRVIFGDLIIYEVDNSLFVSRVFTANVSDILIGGDSGFAMWPQIYKGRNLPEVFVTPVNGNESSLGSQDSLDYSVTPSQIIDVPPYPLAYKENALSELPKPRFLPNSLFYWLILLKEKIQLFSTSILNRHLVELDLAGKRLSEIFLLNQKGNRKLSEMMKKEYWNEMNVALDSIHQERVSGLINDTDLLNLKRIFARHEIILDELGDKLDLENLKVKLSEMGFIPYYDLKGGGGMDQYGRKVYRFDVQKEGNYEILLSDLQSRSLYQGNLDEIPVQINDKVETLSTHQNGDFLSLGYVSLNKGLNEISYNTIDSVNLIPGAGSSNWTTSGQVSMTSAGNQISYELNTNKSDDTVLSFPITGFDDNSLYRIDFEFWIKNGQGPILQAEQSSDWYVDGKRFMDINKQYDKDNYNFFWASASILFQPRANTKDATINFVAKPWSNCLEILNDKKLCSDENIFKKYNRETDFVIRNITVRRVFTNDMVLRSPNVGGVAEKPLKIDITQLSPSYYEGTLTLDKPTSLVLLNTFHPEWKLTLTQGSSSKIIPENQHFLADGYANLWYLNEKPGQYKIKIEFMPQKRFYIGIGVSVAGVILLIVTAYLYSHRQKK